MTASVAASVRVARLFLRLFTTARPLERTSLSCSGGHPERRAEPHAARLYTQRSSHYLRAIKNSPLENSKVASEERTDQQMLPVIARPGKSFSRREHEAVGNLAAARLVPRAGDARVSDRVEVVHEAEVGITGSGTRHVPHLDGGHEDPEPRPRRAVVPIRAHDLGICRRRSQSDRERPRRAIGEPLRP
jgi:hypothetical protein